MSKFERVERVTATTQVVNSVKIALQKGKFKIGDKLPPESEISQELGVGRSSVREGMRMLAAYGVVEIRQGDGTYVVNRFAEHVFDFMGFLPTAENILFMVEMRRVLEVGSLGLIYDKLNDAQCEELRLLAEQIIPGGDTAHNIKADAQFHVKLIEYTNNPLLIETYHMMRALMSALMGELMRRDDVVRDARESHLAVYNALKNKDYTELNTAMSSHLHNVLVYSMEYYPKSNAVIRENEE